MIHVTRLDHRQIIVNADLIKYVESTPDTIVTLTSGEVVEEVVFDRWNVIS